MYTTPGLFPAGTIYFCESAVHSHWNKRIESNRTNILLARTLLSSALSRLAIEGFFYLFKGYSFVFINYVHFLYFKVLRRKRKEVKMGGRGEGVSQSACQFLLAWRMKFLLFSFSSSFFSQDIMQLVNTTCYKRGNIIAHTYYTTSMLLSPSLYSFLLFYPLIPGAITPFSFFLFFLQLLSGEIIHSFLFLFLPPPCYVLPSSRKSNLCL